MAEDLADPTKPCCERLPGHVYCVLPYGHDGVHLGPPPRELPRGDFMPKGTKKS
jgi:hypothetical protein